MVKADLLVQYGGVSPKMAEEAHLRVIDQVSHVHSLSSFQILNFMFSAITLICVKSPIIVRFFLKFALLNVRCSC